MATNDYTQPTPEQMKVAFGEIADMAEALRHLCYQIITEDDGGQTAVAAVAIAAQIGWVADRCICFDHHSPEYWLLPPSWNFASLPRLPWARRHCKKGERDEQTP